MIISRKHQNYVCNKLFQSYPKCKKHNLWLITLVLALVITEIIISVMSFIFHGGSDH
jgi:hypothetical protein